MFDESAMEDNAMLFDVVRIFINFIFVSLATAGFLITIVYAIFSSLDAELLSKNNVRNKSDDESGPLAANSTTARFDILDFKLKDHEEFIPFDWDKLLEDSKKDPAIYDLVKTTYDTATDVKNELEKTKNIPEKEWAIKADTNGISVKSHKRNSSEPAIFKIETIVDAPPHLVLRAIAMPKNRIQWDKTITLEDLHSFNNTLLIRRTITDSLAAGAISSRDFIDIVGLSSEPDGTLRFASKDYSAFGHPDVKGCVRGKNFGSGVWLTPTQKRHDPASSKYLGDTPSSHYVGIVQVDIKGWVPQSIIDFAMTSNVTDTFPPLRKWTKEKYTHGGTI